jgi:hypothetical protein
MSEISRIDKEVDLILSSDDSEFRMYLALLPFQEPDKLHKMYNALLKWSIADRDKSGAKLLGGVDDFFP